MKHPNHGALPPAMLIDMDDTIITLTETSTRCWAICVATLADRLSFSLIACPIYLYHYTLTFTLLPLK